MSDIDRTLLPEDLLAHAGWVRKLAHALVFDQSRVDDVVQETWLAALERAPARARNPRAWLGGVLRKVIREFRRSEDRRSRRERRCARTGELPSPDELVAKAEMQRRVVEIRKGVEPVLELGSAKLEVRAEPGSRVFLIRFLTSETSSRPSTAEERGRRSARGSDSRCRCPGRPRS